jgi:ABC-type taurine transport system ATPase subunit
MNETQFNQLLYAVSLDIATKITASENVVVKNASGCPASDLENLLAGYDAKAREVFFLIKNTAPDHFHPL